MTSLCKLPTPTCTINFCGLSCVGDANLPEEAFNLSCSGLQALTTFEENNTPGYCEEHARKQCATILNSIRPCVCTH